MGVRRTHLIPLVMAVLATAGCLDMTDYTWNVWVSNSSAEPFIVEVTRPAAAAAGPQVDAYRLPAHSTMAAAGGGKGTGFVASLYGPDCRLALTVPVERGSALAYIDSTGTAQVKQALTQTPSDAPQPRYEAQMAITTGCSAEWKASHPGFTEPPTATSARPSGPALASSSAPIASAAYGIGVANGLTVPVTVDVNGTTVGTVAAGSTEDWDPATLPAKPWAVVARSSSGAVLVTMTVGPNDYLSANSGKAGMADLACGRIALWAGARLTGGPTFVPDPSKPCE